PCHPNPNAADDRDVVAKRGDIANLPKPLKDRLIRLADRPHSILPLQVFAEADQSSQLFQYYLLDSTGFEPNVFTKIFPGVNDNVQLTATGANCGLPTVGAVRIVLEPKPGLPTDPNDAKAFIDVFTDISGLFVINNESGWYEGWMIHDLTVAPVNKTKRADGHAQFGTVLPEDVAVLKAMGSGNNVPGHFFTVDGETPHAPSASDHFPDKQTNLISLYLSMGAYNALQQSDPHSYWEFNYLGTNWIHPLYELPFTGGFPDNNGVIDALDDGEIGKLQSIVPGSGPSGVHNRAKDVGDNPNLPRDPDKFDGTVDAQREFRQRGVPSGLAHEIYLDVYERLASFEPEVKKLEHRLNDAYAAEVARVDLNGDGIISAVEGDADTPTDGFPDNRRLYLSPLSFNRFAVTREINDGLLAPRFSPSQRAWVLSGTLVEVDPPVAASAGRDADDR
ncbi:MAG TPA: hypothetical protein VNO35_31445, partial [Steroidobacteraceae bacterium]|nr:hypothetical protein [Steroidobacteraceae bacterium]